MKLKFEDIINKQRNETHIQSKKINNCLEITLNRPSKQNALTTYMYYTLTKLINQASEDQSTQLIIIKGNGKSFSSGNDLSNFTLFPELISDQQLKKEVITMMGNELLYKFVDSFVVCKKPIIAMVQGNVIGVGFTILGLCDMIYCTKDTTFRSPLLQLALGPEGCSSYTFTKLFGKQKAFEYIVLGNKVSGQELAQSGFINKMFNDYSEMENYVQKNIRDYIGGLDYQSIWNTKRLMNYPDNYEEQLRKVNRLESDNWIERCLADAMMEAAIKMMTKSKPQPKL